MPQPRESLAVVAALSLLCMTTAPTSPAIAQAMPAQDVSPSVPRSITKTQKPPLHGQRWMAITGKPLAATAGAMMFQRGGNAVDAACAMIAATSTMWDVLSWGGETQALIYDPRAKKVVAINGLGVAPSGATAAFYRGKGYKYPPEHGPLAAVTPGTPGGLMLMLQEYGTLSLAEVLQPAIELADGYPIDAEKSALAAGKSRKEAIQAAYDRFYRGDVAQEFVRGVQEQGGLITLADLANWKPKIEAPLSVNYRGIDVYKLDVWTQGPALLQSLNILENFDLRTMGYNSASYVHTVYQAMNLAFADRDFYYGDPDFAPEEPTQGLLSKAYAKQRAATIRADRNDPAAGPGDPYPFQGGKNPFADLLAKQRRAALERLHAPELTAQQRADFLQAFRAGTTSQVAADADGWLVAVTPSGGWIPAVIAGRTGIGLSQRAQSFVLDPAENPFNVIEPGKRPRVTLTPSLALRDGRPWLAFAVQGGDTQDQNLLQFFLNVVEFGMTPQEAVEAANFNSYQMKASFDLHESQPGRVVLNASMPQWVRRELALRGYTMEFEQRTSGPINAIQIDPENGSFWGGSSNYGEDYGIGW